MGEREGTEGNASLSPEAEKGGEDQTCHRFDPGPRVFFQYSYPFSCLRLFTYPDMDDFWRMEPSLFA